MQYISHFKELFLLLYFHVYLPMGPWAPQGRDHSLCISGTLCLAQSYLSLDFCPINEYITKCMSLPGVEGEYYFRSLLQAVWQTLHLIPITLLDAFAFQKRIMLIFYESDHRWDTRTIDIMKAASLHEIGPLHCLGSHLEGKTNSCESLGSGVQTFWIQTQTLSPPSYATLGK